MGLRIIDRNLKNMAPQEYEAQMQAQLSAAAALWSNSVGASTASNEAGFIAKVTESRNRLHTQADAADKAEDINHQIRDQHDVSLKLQTHLDFRTLIKLLQ